jgi:hypothetical protein
MNADAAVSGAAGERTGSRRARFGAWLWPLLLVPMALLPDLGAALPLRSYYFRDFTLGFYPLRLFQARELLAGRLPFWNPYLHEGAFALPALYPLDLLHVVWPSAAFVSWLLTLHLPLAALAAYALARELDAPPPAAFVGGSVYALGGFALSCLNLYVFLQALAWAPLLVLALRRAAARGRAWIAWAALALALSLSTLALELVAQALGLGLLLALLAPVPDGPRPALKAARLAAALALGVGLAALPVCVTWGVLREAPRGAGFAAAEAASFALPPVGLLQALVARLFGALDRPLEVWWGGRFFPGGFPYFASLYLGPLALALVWPGLAARPRRERLLLGGVALLGVLYALGPAGGVWTPVHEWPLVRLFRFPSKALFSAHLVAALLAASGASRLGAGRGWRAFGATAGALALVSALVAAAPLVALERLGAWLQLDARALGQLRAELPADAAATCVVALLGAGLALAVHARRLPAPRALALLALVVVLDLARAGAGLNPQVASAFFDPLPGLRAQRLDTLGGGRVFPSPPLHSRTFRAWLDTRPPALGALAFYVDRQLLDPYTNVIDGVETAATVDRTGFVAQPPDLGGADYDPARLEAALPRLRNAAVTRVLSLDPLASASLRLLATVPVPPTPLRVHVYALDPSWPRAYVACRARLAASRAEAAAAPYAADFDPARDVALEAAPGSPLGAGTICRAGSVHALGGVAGRERWSADADGPGFVVIRASHARGWEATVDGKPVLVLRANGRQRAVAIPAGRHEVVFTYAPPGLRLGLALTLAALAGTLTAAWTSRRPR